MKFRWLVLFLLIRTSGFACAQSQHDAVWIKGLGIRVRRESKVYAMPNVHGQVLRAAHKDEILTSLGPAKNGWFKVYWDRNSRAYIQLENVEKMWRRDAKGNLLDAWMGYHDALSDYYEFEIVNPESADQGESVPLRVSYYFQDEYHLTADSVTCLGLLPIGFVVGKLAEDAFGQRPTIGRAALHRKAVELLANYGPLARAGIIYLLNSKNWRDHLHAAEVLSVVTGRLRQAERSDPQVISTWLPGMGGLGEVNTPGMYYPWHNPPAKGLPDGITDEQILRDQIRKSPELTKKVYAALRKFYAIGRSPEMVGRMKALLKSKRREVREAAAKALKPLGSSRGKARLARSSLTGSAGILPATSRRRVKSEASGPGSPGGRRGGDIPVAARPQVEKNDCGGLGQTNHDSARPSVERRQEYRRHGNTARVRSADFSPQPVCRTSVRLSSP